MRSAGFRAATAVLVGGLAVASASIADAGERPAYDDNYNRSVIALDLDDGKQVWRINPSQGRWLNASVAGHGLALISESTCAEGTDDEPRTWAVDLDSGDERWSAHRGTTVGGPAGKGILLGWSGNGTSGIDVESGEVVWKLPQSVYPAASSKHSFFTTGTIDEQPSVDEALTLHVFDRATAKEQWSVDIADHWGAFGQLMVVRADARSVVVQYSDPAQILLGRSPTATQTVSFITLDATTGAERARIHIDTPPGAQLPTLVATDDLLVYPDNDQVIARDLATGDVRWTHRFDVTQREPLMGTPDDFRYLRMGVSSGADHTVFARTVSGGSFVVHALDTTTGTERWSVRDSWMLESTGHTTLLSVDNEKVMDVDTRTGRTRWTAVIPGGGRFELVAYVSDRRVIVSSACPE